ncbi:MAG: flagellar hook-basal body complex protein FliE [Halieaceae bacterium]|jgi:flagellar hook-basal body complex protein FliE
MSEIAMNQVLAQMRTMSAGAGSEISTRNSGESDGVSFSSLMQDSLEQVNADMMQAKALATSFETGTPGVSLAEVMISSQKAGLEFQAVTEVRNKLLSAYQEIMSMQV